MTHYVLASTVSDPAAFQQRVQEFCAELTAYDVHFAKVQQGEAQAYPSPAQGMHSDIVASVRKVGSNGSNGSNAYVPDYRLVEFMPVIAGDVTGLLARKSALAHRILELQEASTHRLLPARKWRYATLLHAQAAGKKEAHRTSADNDLIAEHQTRMSTLQKIHLHYAKQEAEVEDLGFDTINDWRPQPFPEA